MTRAAAIMSREVVCVTPSYSAIEALRLMREEGVRHLPVVSRQKLVGVLSDRDLLGNQDLDREVVTLMTPLPITCPPSATVGRLAELMVQQRIDCVPIVEGDTLVGIITSTDLLELLTKRNSPLSQVLPVDFVIRQLGAFSAAVNA